MKKKKNTFLYLMWHDLFIPLGTLLFCLFLVLLVKVGRMEFSAHMMDILFVMLAGIMLGPTCLSYMKQSSFLTFHFNRKRFYRYQALLSVIRAVELAVIRAGYQYGMQREFMYAFLEDTEDTIFMYHSVSFIELFVTNICIFTLINLWYLILNTLTVNFYLIKGGNGEISPQLRLRINCQKEKHLTRYCILTVVSKIVSFIVMVAVCLLIIYYYQVEMQTTPAVRLLVLAGLVVICGILYLIGKKRYCPEYI